MSEFYLTETINYIANLSFKADVSIREGDYNEARFFLHIINMLATETQKELSNEFKRRNNLEGN